MIVSPVGERSGRAVADLLRAHGWDAGLAASAADGAAGAALHVQQVDEPTLQALVVHGGRLGLEVLTGPDWALIAGSRSRLSALARPWTVPPDLAALADAVGRVLPPEPPREWRVRNQVVSLAHPVIMGIVNVTPDSFSDGGRHGAPGAALAHAEQLVAAGATILDIGGESTRPGRDRVVPATEETARVVPIIAAVRRALPDIIVTVDTMKADVADAALGEGAHAVNDVTALRHDARMAEVVAAAGAGVILMHSRGGPLELGGVTHAAYGDIVADVLDELGRAVATAGAAGIAPDAVAVDPGFGFGKTAAQNFALADRVDALGALGRPLVVGPSRKRFLGAATGRDTAERDTATAVAVALLRARGAHIFRVHDAAAARDALAVAEAFSAPTDP